MKVVKEWLNILDNLNKKGNISTFKGIETNNYSSYKLI